MLLQELSWKDVENYLKTDKRVVLVLGATEEHSDLSLCTDTLIPLEIAKEACQKQKVILLPALNYGLSTWSLAYPGTISLKTSTYVHVIEDILDSLICTGFRKFFILNGHGFNRSVIPAIVEKMANLEDGVAYFYNWYEFTCIKDFAYKHGNLRLAHANWAENFSFTHFKDTNRAAISHNISVPNFLQSIKQIRNEFAEGHGPGDLEIEYSQMEILKENLINEFSEILACT